MDTSAVTAEADRIFKTALNMSRQPSLLDTFDAAEERILHWIRMSQHRPEYVAAAQLAHQGICILRREHIESTVQALLTARTREPERGDG